MESASLRLSDCDDKHQRLMTETENGRQIVWQHLEDSLRYLQIEALGRHWNMQSLQRRRGSSADLAIRRSDRTGYFSRQTAQPIREHQLTTTDGQMLVSHWRGSPHRTVLAIVLIRGKPPGWSIWRKSGASEGEPLQTA